MCSFLLKLLNFADKIWLWKPKCKSATWQIWHWSQKKPETSISMTVAWTPVRQFKIPSAKMNLNFWSICSAILLQRRVQESSPKLNQHPINSSPQTGLKVRISKLSEQQAERRAGGRLRRRTALSQRGWRAQTKTNEMVGGERKRQI